jgi:acetate kinase
MTVTNAILVLNAGSSSIKFSIHPADHLDVGEHALCRGEIDGIGHALRLLVRDGTRQAGANEIEGAATHHHALEYLLDWIEQHATGFRLVAAGHRIVHGGDKFADPVVLTPEIVRALERIVPLAPLHQPHNLAAIAALTKLHPALPQVACFDTAFHRTQPPVATAIALPRTLTDKGVRRYGFHGLSYEYIVDILPTHLGASADGKVIVAHLGQGASMCAMERRRSVATTMGFTTLDGLVMGRRCGSIDPGVILYLMDVEQMEHGAISQLLYERSGLLGVSEMSDDMRELLASADQRASEAIELFVYRIGRELGSLAAALAGLDALVFTGGIGEHSPDIRARVCRQARWLGARIDQSANEAGGPRLSLDDSPVSLWAFATDEEQVIARHTRALI